MLIYNVTLLGVMPGKNLTIKRQIDNLICKTQYKLHVLRRISKFFTIEKAKFLGNAFIDCQFNYAPLILMFCEKKHFILKLKKFTIGF